MFTKCIASYGLFAFSGAAGVNSALALASATVGVFALIASVIVSRRVRHRVKPSIRRVKTPGSNWRFVGLMILFSTVVGFGRPGRGSGESAVLIALGVAGAVSYIIGTGRSRPPQRVPNASQGARNALRE